MLPYCTLSIACILLSYAFFVHTSFSTPVEWVDLDEHLEKFGKMVKKVPGNGMCFVEAVIEGLKDLGEKEMDVEVMKGTILNEMYN